MKLVKLKINNFRGLKGDNNIIEFSDSNIIFLIGQNNVGKSTYLRAYEFFTNSGKKAELEDFNNHSESNPIIIEGWFLKENEDESDPELKGKSKEPDWLNKWADSNNIIKVRKQWTTIGALFQKQTYLPLDKEWVNNGFGGLDTLFTKYAPKPISINAMENETSLEEKVNKLIQDDFIKKVKLDHTDLCLKITENIKELQRKITDSDAVKNMNSDLNELFKKTFDDLSLKIEANKEENIKIEDAFKKNHTVTIERENSNRKESFLQNGHGVIRQALFNFLAFLQKEKTTTRKEYIILFEEPELFLHPKVAFKLRESLYDLAQNSPYQILCATHSPLMIDISKPHSSLIRVTKNVDDVTFAYQVGENVFRKDESQKQRVQMINRFNPHICEAFYADKVLLVEGDTESIVYRELLNKYYINEEIFVLNTGSKNNIPFFQEILIAFQIEHYVIHDTDKPKDKNGNVNSAWTLNQKIWDKIVEANSVKKDLARRYTFNYNFESAHNIILSGENKDKPLSAYRFVTMIDVDKDMPDCLKWLNDILNNQVLVHDMKYINSLVLNDAPVKKSKLITTSPRTGKPVNNDLNKS